MCTTNITKITDEIPKYGWKVFMKDGKEFKSIYANLDQKYEIGGFYQSKNKKDKASVWENFYRVGFHVFFTEKQAENYKRYLCLSMIVVIKVAVKGVRLKGCSDICDYDYNSKEIKIPDTFICDQIKILKD